jgi:hypothetical protein
VASGLSGPAERRGEVAEMLRGEAEGEQAAAGSGELSGGRKQSGVEALDGRVISGPERHHAVEAGTRFQARVAWGIREGAGGGGHFLDVWTNDPNAIPDDIRDAYLTASLEAMPSIVADYSSYPDLETPSSSHIRETGWAQWAFSAEMYR